MRITTAVAVCLTDQKKALQWERLLICRNQMPISSGNRLRKWTCVYSTAGELINLGNPKKIKVIFLTTKILILNYIVTLLLIFFFAQITNILGLIIIVAHCSYCINCHLCHKFRRLHECNSNFHCFPRRLHQHPYSQIDSSIRSRIQCRALAVSENI